MVFGFGKDSDSEEEKKKKQQEEEEAKKKAGRRRRPGKRDSDPDTDEEEESKRPGGRRRPGRKNDGSADEEEDEEEGKKRPGGRRRRPGKRDSDPDTDEEEESKRPGGRRRPGRKNEGSADEEEEEGKPGRPHGRPGRKKDDEEEEEEGKPGRPHGRPGRKKDDEEEEEEGKPGRPHGRPGRKKDDDEEEEGKPGRPHGRPGRKNDEDEEHEAPGHGRPHGRPGRKNDDEEEEEHEAPGHGKPHGRPGRKNDEDEEHEAPGHGRPQHGRPQHGRKDEDEHEAPGHGRPQHGKHGAGAAAGAAAAGAAAAGAAAAAGHGKHNQQQQQQQQQHAPSHTNPMEVDHNNENAQAAGGHGGQGHGGQGHQQADQNSEQAKIEEQRRKDEAERIRLQKIADNQPQQPQQPQQPHQPHHGSGHNAGSGGTVTVKEGESIQAALDAASPGTTILIEAGTYHEALKSRVDGTKEQPITLQGPSSGPTAIIKGADKSGTCVEINHDYYILNDFTIDGLIKEDCNKDNVRECFRAKCLAVRGNRQPRDHTNEKGVAYKSAVDGVVVKNMKIYNCGGEGIRIRYFVTNCVLFHNRITSTGCYDFKFDEGDHGVKNGEGIYVGTSSKQWSKNVTDEPDICRWTRIYENYIDTHGNECVDVKEGAVDTVIETNYCTGQLDEDSAGIDSRASSTTIRYNKVVGCKGAGVRLGGHKVGREQYGVNCKVYCNILENNEYAGVKVMTEPNEICQNTISGSDKAFRGDAAKSFEEGSECPFDVKPPQQDMETTRWFQNCKP